MKTLFSMLFVFILIAGWVSGCAEEHQAAAIEDTNPPLTDLSGLPGTLCNNNPLSVRINDGNGTVFCIDRFEASTDSGSTGNVNQGSDGADLSLDGSTATKALVGLNQKPTTNLSWYQAKAACQNAGKRLCTLTEWTLACSGIETNVYPYGHSYDENACNGFFHYAEVQPFTTGSLSLCASSFGVYDLSGNLAEWTNDAVSPSVEGGPLEHRALRGGSYRSNYSSLRCTGAEFHAAPDSHADDVGFRCCSDLAD